MGKCRKECKVKLSELCFYIFFVSLLFAKGIGLYDGQTKFKIFFVIALAGWAGKMLLERYSVREALLSIALVLLGGGIYLVSREKGALIVILLLCGMRNMDIRRVFRVGAITWGISFGTLFVLTSLHVVDSAFKVHDRLGMGRVIRWNLGYAHPNVLHISYLVMICFVVYLLQDRLRLYHLLLLEAGNLYVFMFSLSTTGFLVSTACLVLVFYWKLRKRLGRVEQILIQLCLPACLFLSFGAPLLFEGKLFDVLNQALNTRLALSKWFLQNQPVKLLGVDTTTIVTALRTMDNSYVFALITYGWVFFVFIMICYFDTVCRRSVRQDGMALCLILSCLVAGITEPFLFNTSFKNISLLFVGAELSDRMQGDGRKVLDLGQDRSITIGLPNFSGVCVGVGKRIYRYLPGLVVLSVAGAMLAGIIVSHRFAEPERYLLPRKAFEYTDDLEESYYLKSEDDIPQAGDSVMGFESENTEMVAFKGNIARMEQFRNTVANGAMAGVLIFIVGCGLLFLKTKNMDGKLTDEK